MIRYVLLLLFSAPLLACADDAADSASPLFDQRVNIILSGNGKLEDRQYWRSLLKWSDDCEGAFQGPMGLHVQDADSDSGIVVYPASNRQYLVAVTCVLGAYQGYHLYYFISFVSGNIVIKPLLFPVFEIEGNNNVIKTMTAEVWGNVRDDSDYSGLTIFNRYSGYGHCGTLTTYRVIDGEVGVVKLLAQPDCENRIASRDPAQWAEYAIP